MINRQRIKVQELEIKITELYDQVWKQHLSAVIALKNNSVDELKKVTEQEKKININYNFFFKKSLYHLAQYNFYASPLRKILAFLHIANELERIGDFANNLCLFILKSPFQEKDKKNILLLLVWNKLLIHFGKVKKLFSALKSQEILEFLKNNSNSKKIVIKEFIKGLQFLSNENNNKFDTNSVYFLEQFYALKRTFEHLENIVEYLLLIQSFKEFKEYKKI